MGRPWPHGRKRPDLRRICARGSGGFWVARARQFGDQLATVSKSHRVRDKGPRRVRVATCNGCNGCKRSRVIVARRGRATNSLAFSCTLCTRAAVPFQRMATVYKCRDCGNLHGAVVSTCGVCGSGNVSSDAPAPESKLLMDPEVRAQLIGLLNAAWHFFDAAAEWYRQNTDDVVDDDEEGADAEGPHSVRPE